MFERGGFMACPMVLVTEELGMEGGFHDMGVFRFRRVAAGQRTLG